MDPKTNRAAFRMEPVMKAFDLPLTGSVGWEAYDSLLQGCRDAAPHGAASQPQVQERGKDGFDQAAVSECRDVTEQPRLPGLHLEPLKADRKGQYSIRINDRYRICFEWRDGDAYNVEIVDYH